MRKLIPVIIISFLIVFVSHFSTVAAVGRTDQPGYIMTSNGSARAIIIIPGDATARERFAAEELQKYVQRISGAKLEIQPDSKKTRGNLILIGGPSRNKVSARFIDQQTFDAAVSGPEGMMIKTFGNRALLLAGNSKFTLEYERGTLYAVYEFLEANLGCSFVSFGKPGMGLGEYIPSRRTITMDKIDYVKHKADLAYRTAIVQYFKDIPFDHGLSMALIDWLAKNKYNRINTMATVYEAWKRNGLLKEAQKRGILFTVGHHESSALFLPPDGNSYFPEHYHKTHPEYYKLMADGTRFHPETIWKGQWVFDSRNQAAIEQMAINITAWLNKNPYVDIVCLWPNDGKAPQCVDSLCKPYSKVENYTYFVNEVAKKVKKNKPHIKIDLLSYFDLRKYPESVQLDPSLIVDHANFTRTYGKKDGSSLLGTSYEKSAKAWAKGGATVVYYEYYMSVFSRNQVYFPMADELYAIYNNFKADGYCEGTGTQLEAHNIWNFLLNFYVHARTSYNTSLTLSDNLDRFCKIFGKGAPFIRQYLTYAESFYEDQGARFPGRWFAQNVDKEKVYRYFEQAYQAEPEGVLRNNIRMLRMAFRYSDLYTNGGGNGELKYMYDHYDSYGHNPGYGIAIRSEGSGIYTPDKWYQFDN